VEEYLQYSLLCSKRCSALEISLSFSFAVLRVSEMNEISLMNYFSIIYGMAVLILRRINILTECG